jgi:hypothetical protein
MTAAAASIDKIARRILSVMQRSANPVSWTSRRCPQKTFSSHRAETEGRDAGIGRQRGCIVESAV